MHYHIVKKLWTGQGIGGFVGGQLLSSAGFSLPLLFQVTAAFLIGWEIILYFIYKCFCKRYEEKLISSKEAEVFQLEANKQKDENFISTIDLPNTDILQKQNLPALSTKMKSDLEFDDAPKCENSQVVGVSEL